MPAPKQLHRSWSAREERSGMASLAEQTTLFRGWIGPEAQTASGSQECLAVWLVKESVSSERKYWQGAWVFQKRGWQGYETPAAKGFLAQLLPRKGRANGERNRYPVPRAPPARAFWGLTSAANSRGWSHSAAGALVLSP